MSDGDDETSILASSMIIYNSCALLCQNGDDKAFLLFEVRKNYIAYLTTPVLWILQWPCQQHIDMYDVVRQDVIVDKSVSGRFKRICQRSVLEI